MIHALIVLSLIQAAAQAPPLPPPACDRAQLFDSYNGRAKVLYGDEHHQITICSINWVVADPVEPTLVSGNSIGCGYKAKPVVFPPDHGVTRYGRFFYYEGSIDVPLGRDLCLNTDPPTWVTGIVRYRFTGTYHLTSPYTDERRKLAK